MEMIWKWLKILAQFAALEDLQMWCKVKKQQELGTSKGFGV